MVKASLKSVSDEFIEKKAVNKHISTKPQERKNTITPKRNNTKKVRQNFYLSEEVSKILWQHRVDTGENLSSTVERLVREHITKKKSKKAGIKPLPT